MDNVLHVHLLQGGNNYDARLRRAAMAQRRDAGSDDSEEDESSGDEEASSGNESDGSGSGNGQNGSHQPRRRLRDIDMEAVEQMSDDEAKAELKQYHQQKLMEAAHVGLTACPAWDAACCLLLI